MLTARDTVNDRVVGLDSGADDYLVKPFAYDELAARLRALGRRSEGAARRSEPRLVAGPISLDEATRSVTIHDRPIDLSPREFSLLESLLRHPGQALSRDQLLDQAWPFGVAVTPNAVDAYVHYLRTKLGSEGERIENEAVARECTLGDPRHDKGQTRHERRRHRPQQHAGFHGGKKNRIAQDEIIVVERGRRAEGQERLEIAKERLPNQREQRQPERNGKHGADAQRERPAPGPELDPRRPIAFAGNGGK